MYLTNEGRTYYKGTSQCHSRAPFLILVQLKGFRGKLKGHMRALVRRVALEQTGHWMMGTARIFGKSYTISGGYGGDGLPIEVDERAYEAAAPVPDELFDLWNTGGGWNSAGAESVAMRKWALETFFPGMKKEAENV